MTRSEITKLVRTHASTPVLSVLMKRPKPDPPDSDIWGPRLDAVVSKARAGIVDVPDEEAEALDRAHAHAREAVTSLPRVMPAPGWAILATEDRLLHSGPLPFAPVERGRWGVGVDAGGLLMATRSHDPVRVAVLDQWRARLFIFEDWDLEEVRDLTAQPGSLDEITEGTRKGASTTTGVRGATRRDRASRALSRERLRFLTDVAAELRALEGDHRGYAVGGAVDAAHALQRLLEDDSTDDVVGLAGVGVDSNEREIRDACAAGTHALLASHQNTLLDMCREADSGAGLGPQQVEKALATSAGRTLLIADSVVKDSLQWANTLITDAVLAGADVEVLTGVVSEQLAGEGEGVGVLLRFSTE